MFSFTFNAQCHHVPLSICTTSFRPLYLLAKDDLIQLAHAMYTAPLLFFQIIDPIMHAMDDFISIIIHCRTLADDVKRKSESQLVGV